MNFQPFEEIEHTADIAFIVRGQSMQEIGAHAQQALCEKFPELTVYKQPFSDNITLDDIIIGLNEMITRADIAEGCGLKAISFHGDVHRENEILTWEMILDV